MTNLARQAVKNYPHRPYIDRKNVNSLRRQWINKITELGAKWILHPDNKTQRLENVKETVL